MTFVTSRFSGQPSDRSVDSIMQPASRQLIVRHGKNSVQKMTGTKDNYAINERIINLFAKLR